MFHDNFPFSITFRASREGLIATLHRNGGWVSYLKITNDERRRMWRMMFMKTRNEGKLFKLKFFDFPFFHHFGQKRQSPRKKLDGKNVRSLVFWFKIRFEAFWIDSEKPKSFNQKFLTLPFFTIFGLKQISPR